jgi:hypothetical protein
MDCVFTLHPDPSQQKWHKAHDTFAAARVALRALSSTWQPGDGVLLDEKTTGLLIGYLTQTYTSVAWLGYSFTSLAAQICFTWLFYMCASWGILCGPFDV